MSFTFMPDADFKVKTRVLARFATGGVDRWRVWSVSRGGGMRVGTWRAFTVQQKAGIVLDMFKMMVVLLGLCCGAWGQAGVLSAKMLQTSKIYDGMVSEYWVYVPAAYDPAKPAALMVFQDGQGYLDRKGDHAALNVLDELMATGKIPVMIAVFVNPGDISGSPGTGTYKFVEAYGKKWSRTLKDSMRSTEYDTVSDRYDRFLRDELLPAAVGQYNVRKDAYSRAITGLSSGGICSFNAAWQMPDQFARVITWIGSFTAIQWHEDPAVADGGQDFPEKILREAHRNLRVWVQDGAGDQENDRYGSWPMANLRVANALKLKGYDFHFSFGKGPHSAAEGGAEFAQEMTWLWRGYDPTRTEEMFVQDAAEKALPVYRLGIVNR